MINNEMHPNQRSQKIRMKSFVGDRWHVISLNQKTCDCEQFQVDQRCKHMSALGLYRTRSFTPPVRPTFSQALSGLVKSIRIRRVDEAVYWLVYLDTFKEKQYRFRTARRLLIGSAEDGHSIPVMELIADEFRSVSKLEADLWHLAAETIKICKSPNWWHPDSGGPDYIYQSPVGYRQWKYKQWDHRLKTLEHEIASAIDCRDKAMAIGGVTACSSLEKPEQVGATKQAEFLLRLADERKHDGQSTENRQDNFRLGVHSGTRRLWADRETGRADLSIPPHRPRIVLIPVKTRRTIQQQPRDICSLSSEVLRG
jgi:hypothetical protein